jgi:Mn2+/Fe2+ NRAMP family transporter
MFVFVFANFLAIPLFFLAHPHVGAIATHFVVPGIEGGANSTSVLLIIAIVGTTVAPWQLFFQQSNVIDKRITPRWINYERLDTWIGAFVVVIGAAALMAVSRVRLPPHSLLRPLHRRRRHGVARSATLGSVAGRSSRSCCSTPR